MIQPFLSKYITPAEQSLLTDIANSRTKTAFKAQTCLYIARGIEFPVLLPTDTGDYTVFKNNETLTNTNLVVLATPNPAKDQTTFGYNLDDDQTAQLTLYDLTGRLMHQTTIKGTGTYTLQTNTFTNGLYLYTISNNQGVIYRNRLTIVK